MYTYHHVNLAVIPKKEKLLVAQAQLDETNERLHDAQGKLWDITQKIDTLELTYGMSKQKQTDLEAQVYPTPFPPLPSAVAEPFVWRSRGVCAVERH
jgi:hypothetical protein